MMHKLTERLAVLSDRAAAYALQVLLEPLMDRYKSVTFNSAGLVIQGAGATIAKTGATVTHYMANGILGRIAAGTNMPALTGINVTQGNFNVVLFSVDSAGTLYVRSGTQGATEAQVKWPQLDQRRAILGLLVINPGGGAFTGGTTALDNATAFATGGVAYINTVSMFDPTTRIS